MYYVFAAFLRAARGPRASSFASCCHFTRAVVCTHPLFYDRPLGAPLGVGAIVVANGSRSMAWQWQFEHANVTLDCLARTARIDGWAPSPPPPRLCRQKWSSSTVAGQPCAFLQSTLRGLVARHSVCRLELKGITNISRQSQTDPKVSRRRRLGARPHSTRQNSCRLQVVPVNQPVSMLPCFGVLSSDAAGSTRAAQPDRTPHALLESQRSSSTTSRTGHVAKVRASSRATLGCRGEIKDYFSSGGSGRLLATQSQPLRSRCGAARGGRTHAGTDTTPPAPMPARR